MAKVNEALVNAETLATAIGTDGTTITDSALSVLGAIGANNANNAFSSNSVVANGDGSALEREELIQRNIGAFDGGADAQGDIFQALGVGTTKSVKGLIDDLDTVVDGVGTKVDTIDGNVDDIEASVGALTDVADETINTATLIGMIRQLLSNRALPRVARKTVAFDGGAGSGGAGTVALFTVTGAVKAKVYAICTENIVGAATLEIGVSGNTASIIAQIVDATDLDLNEIYFDATPTTNIDDDSSIPNKVIAGGQDIIATIGTTDITNGTIVFYVEWVPITSDGAVIAA